MRLKHSPIVDLQFNFHYHVLSHLFYYYNLQFEIFYRICSFLPSLHFLVSANSEQVIIFVYVLSTVRFIIRCQF